MDLQLWEDRLSRICVGSFLDDGAAPLSSSLSRSCFECLRDDVFGLDMEGRRARGVIVHTLLISSKYFISCCAGSLSVHPSSYQSLPIKDNT